jgi:hypothetical protein
MTVHEHDPLSALGTEKDLALACHLGHHHYGQVVIGDGEKRTYHVLAVGVVTRNGRDHGVEVANANGVVESRSARVFDEGVLGEVSACWEVQVSRNADSERVRGIGTWIATAHRMGSDGEVKVIWGRATVTACDGNCCPCVESDEGCGYDDHDHHLCYQAP